MTITAPRETRQPEVRALTGLRIVAAAWVVVFHFHFTALGGVADVVAATGPILTAGSLGVDMFFVLSGFVIAYTYLDVLGPRLRARAAGRFVWARAARLWPAYVVVLTLFGAWVIARHVLGGGGPVAFQAVQPDVTVGAWVRQLLLVQLWDRPYFDGASWVGPTWSISAEWLAYLLFPPAALFFHRLRRLPRPVLALGTVALMAPIAASYLVIGSPYFPWSWLVRILCGFGAGVLVFLVVRRIRATTRTRWVASRIADASAVLIVVGLCVGELAGPGRGGAVIVLFPVLVGALAIADGGLARLLSTRAFGYGGRASYSLYLVHIPMFEVYWLAMAYFPTLTGPTVVAHVIGGLVLLATFPVAALLHRVVEVPGSRAVRSHLPSFLREPLTTRDHSTTRDPGTTPPVRPSSGPSRGRGPLLGAVPPMPRPVTYGPPQQRTPRHAAGTVGRPALVSSGVARHARRGPGAIA
ncbi:acyltransferase [Pseudonocardia sp. N23]|uniref:acyltransferase family protein n=1 Tax=Pseudonocardia sp. N23 TaxID=1987376 RepID=UPI000C030429|nr:acyltransferase [Pseudonocardia sp. N23]GAY09190.1 acyltransferase, putative [Pseudonocardia sp. N23]